MSVDKTISETDTLNNFKAAADITSLFFLASSPHAENHLNVTLIANSPALSTDSTGSTGRAASLIIRRRHMIAVFNLSIIMWVVGTPSIMQAISSGVTWVWQKRGSLIQRLTTMGPIAELKAASQYQGCEPLPTTAANGRAVFESPKLPTSDVVFSTGHLQIPEGNSRPRSRVVNGNSQDERTQQQATNAPQHHHDPEIANEDFKLALKNVLEEERTKRRQD